MATLIKIDGTLEEVKPAGKKFTAAELSALVTPGETGYLQYVPLDGRRGFWCHEESKYRDLPLNLMATGYVRHELARVGRDLVPGDILVGDILITANSEVE